MRLGALVLLCGVAACLEPISWVPGEQPHSGCDPFALPAIQAIYPSPQELPGCLRISWRAESQTKANSTRVRISAEGKVYAWDGASLPKIPVDQGAQRISMHLFVFAKGLADSEQVCGQQMSDPGFECQSRPELCHFAFSFKSQTRSTSDAAPEVIYDPDKEGATCHLIVPDKTPDEPPADGLPDGGRPQSQVSTIAGPPTASTDKTNDLLRNPYWLAFDKDGNLYVSEKTEHQIRKLEFGNGSPKVTVWAGIGRPGYGDAAREVARFDSPRGLAISKAGVMYVADARNHVIRKIELDSGRVSTFVGNPSASGLKDGVGPGAQFEYPTGLALSLDEKYLYVTQTGNEVNTGALRRIELSSLKVETLLKQSADFKAINSPRGIAVGADGSVYVADLWGQTILKLPLAKDGTFGAPEILAGKYSEGKFQDGVGGAARFRGPVGLAFDVSRKLLYVSEVTNNLLRVVDTQTKEVTHVAGELETLPLGHKRGVQGATNGAAKTTATLYNPAGLAMRADGTLYIADSGNHRIRTYDPGKEEVGTFSGGRLSDWKDGPALDARFAAPTGVFVAKNGDIYVADKDNNRIRKISKGEVTTVAGDGGYFYQDDANPLKGSLAHPTDLALFGEQLWVSDSANHMIRVVNDKGLNRYAGIGQVGILGESPYDGDGRSTARFNYPYGMTLTSDGTLYVVDRQSRCIRKVVPSSQPQESSQVATLACMTGSTDTPYDVAHYKGILYITNHGSFKIQTMDPQVGEFVDYAGGKLEPGQKRVLPGYKDGPKAEAKFSGLHSIVVDGKGNLYVTEFSNHAIRKIGIDGMVTTIVGQCDPKTDKCKHGFKDGSRKEALFHAPEGLALDNEGNLIVADRGNNRIRKVVLPK